MVGSRLGLALGVGQVEVYASAAARAAVLEAERVAQVAAGAPADVVVRPTRLAEVLVTEHTGRARVHAVLRDVADAQAQLHALQAAAIARLAQLQPAQRGLPGARADDPAGADRPDDWVADEVAVVLGISIGSASSVVAKARALVEQLPQVWAALADGVIDVRRGQVLVDALTDRKHSAGGGLADDVVDTIAAQGLGWIAEGIGPTPLTDRIAAAIITADPAQAQRRAERRTGRQNVTTVGQGDGLASLRTDLADATDVAEEQAMINALAARMRKDGDKRPIGQLRITAHHQLLTRPWETLPADVLRARWQLHLRVDLTDLDDLGPLVDPPADHDPDPEPEPDLGPLVDPPIEHDPDPEPEPDHLGPLVDPPTDHDSDPEPEPGHDGDRGQSDDPGETHTPVETGRPRKAAAGSDAGAGAGAGAGDTSDTTRLRAAVGSGVGSIGGWAVSPVAVAELLARYDALLVTSPTGRVEGGDVWFEITDTTGRLQAITSPAEARAAVRRRTGLRPPPEVGTYEPSAAQTRFVKARDRHCRFPGCHRPAEYVDLDHVIPRDHDNPAAGGPTCITNLVCLCRRHHRLKTHRPDWHFAMDHDGTLHVTPPGGHTRTTRPPGIAEVDMSTRTQHDTLTDLLGRTPKRFRSPTPEERTARREAAAERARIAAEIEAELDAAMARVTAEDRAGRDAPTAQDDDPPPF